MLFDMTKFGVLVFFIMSLLVILQVHNDWWLIDSNLVVMIFEYFLFHLKPSESIFLTIAILKQKCQLLDGGLQPLICQILSTSTTTTTTTTAAAF